MFLLFRSFVFFRSYLALTLITIVLNAAFAQKLYAQDIMDTIIDTLTNMTCESRGMGDLLRTEFSHTCIPASFFTFMVANLISPGLYSNTLLRLKINDPDLFPKTCLRENRADYTNPTISFALCNNLKLQTLQAPLIAKASIAIAGSMFTGQEPWSAIERVLKVDKSKFHEIFNDKQENDEGVMADIGVIPVFPWKVIQQADRICVATIGFLGWIPVGCKYIKEPYPESIYSAFFNNNANSKYSQNAIKLTQCISAGSCYYRAYENSMTGIVILAPLIECIKEMTARFFISKDVCRFEDINNGDHYSNKTTSFLFKFQQNMHRAVTALLTIYVTIYGFRILLIGKVPKKSDFINFLLKFLFVTYFSIGINASWYGSNNQNGMTAWVLPFLLDGMQSMVNWVTTTSSNGLCSFDPGDYQSSLAHLAFLDAINCRVEHYLGLDVMSTIFLENKYHAHNFDDFDFFSFSIPPYVYFLIPAVMSGNLTLISLVLMYPLLVISLIAYIINVIVVSIILIVLLSTLSVIFVPFFLFEYTKEYTISYFRLLISFFLQPMVLTVFAMMMFIVIDAGLYGKCQYIAHQFTSGERQVKVFYVDHEWNNYSDEDAKSCQNSLGFMLNNPLKMFYDGKVNQLTSMSELMTSDGVDNYLSNFSLADGIESVYGILFPFPIISYTQIKDIILSLVIMLIILFLMKYLMDQLSEWAADVTGGISVGGATIKPNTIFNAGMSAINSIGGSMKGRSQNLDSKLESNDSKQDHRGVLSGNKMITDNNLGEDKMSTDNNLGEDKMSTDNNLGEDKMSTDNNLGEDKMSTDNNLGEDKMSTDNNLGEDKMSTDNNPDDKNDK